MANTLFQLISRAVLVAVTSSAIAVVTVTPVFAFADQDTLEAAPVDVALENKSIAKYRTELLELAMSYATAIPLEPHIKDRASAQEDVVGTCLELDQPAMARKFAGKIPNWRKGTAFADLAFYNVRKNDRLTPAAKEYIAAAERVSETALEWREYRIEVHIAKSYAWLGRTKEAQKYEEELPSEEKGKTAVVRAMRADSLSLMEQIVAIDALIASGDFDQVRSGLEAYGQLYNNFYDDAKMRDRIESSMKAASGPMPVGIQMDTLLELASYAIDHKDTEKGLSFVDEAQSLLVSHNWRMEDEVPLSARVATLRYKAGDKEGARKLADGAAALYREAIETAYDMERSIALRHLADTYHAFGDSDRARDMYTGSITAAAANPNSRIRALALSAICCSLALHEVEPDEAMWSRLRGIREGLRDPW